MAQVTLSQLQIATLLDDKIRLRNISGRSQFFRYVGKYGITVADATEFSTVIPFDAARRGPHIDQRKMKILGDLLAADITSGKVILLAQPMSTILDSAPPTQALLANPTTQATVNATGGGAGGGNLGAGTGYLVSYTFVNASGETTVGTSTSAAVNVASGNIPRVTLPAIPSGFSSISLYVTDDTGSTPRRYATGITTTTYDMSAALPALDGTHPAPPVSSTATIAAPSTAATVAVTGGGSTGGLLTPGGYKVLYTFVTVDGGETTVGSSISASFSVADGNIPRVTLPALPSGVASSIRLYIQPVLDKYNKANNNQPRLYAANITTTTVDMSYDYVDFDLAHPAPPASSSTAVAKSRAMAVTDNTLTTKLPSWPSNRT